MKNAQILLMGLVLAISSCAQNQSQPATKQDSTSTYPIVKTEEQWQAQLTPEEYRILREKGTERSFSGDLYNHHENGIYTCAGCSNPLFQSDTKFDSGTGWPSFYAPATAECVEEITDDTHGMSRTEVVCNSCGGHLGHVFGDGPRPTGLRYCINSASLNFEIE